MICPNCYVKYSSSHCENFGEKCLKCKVDLIDENFIIKNVVVKNLFNNFDYTIDFSNNEKVSVLIAPNGFGKSTIFKIINFIYNPTVKNIDKIADIPFDSFTINFTNGAYIILEKNKEEASDFELRKFNFTISGKLSKSSSLKKINIYENIILRKKDLPISKIEEIVFKMELPDFINNVFNLHTIYLDVKRLEISHNKKIKMQLDKTDNKKSNNFNFIELLNPSSEITNMSLFSEDVKTLLSVKDRIDSIIKSKIPNPRQERTLLALTIINKRIKALDLFCKIYNERNALSGKKISYNQIDGFVLKMKNKTIPLECLSDGEKNDFCIFYNLICHKKELTKISSLDSGNTLFIIDEPEVSLHIEWQQTWLDYVLEICKDSNIQVIIATHSPYIVNGHFELYTEKQVKTHGRK